MPNEMNNRDRHGRPVPVKSYVDIPVNSFFDTVDKDALLCALNENDKYTDFLSALCSAEYAHMAPATIMRKFGVTLHDMQMLYRDYRRNQGLIAMSDRLPKIMTDVAIDAETREMTCPRCEGDGIVYTQAMDEDGKKSDPQPKTCPECEGAKVVRKIGDKHARDLVFESMALTNQKVPLVAIQNNQFSGSAGLNSSMEETLRATQRLTMGDRREE